jgi:hypothetical protein
MKVIVRGSLALLGLLLSVLHSNWAPAYADDFCVQLTATEFNQSRRRAGTDNGCSGDRFSHPEFWARERARANANTAIEPQCVNNVTLAMAQHACTRANLVVNTADFNFWGAFPPSARPAANKVEYLGHGIGGASSVNLCAAATDTSITQRSEVDGNCSAFAMGFAPTRVFVTARARARCAVVCRTP